jgi:hypothetical protein
VARSTSSGLMHRLDHHQAGKLVAGSDRQPVGPVFGSRMFR